MSRMYKEFLDGTTIGNALAKGATRALGKVLAKYYLNKGLGYNTYTKLYDSCVCPVMDYASGVWGFCEHDNLEKIHSRAMRCYLGVNKYAAKCGIEGDMCWTPPKIRRSIEILRLWNRLVGMPENRLPKQLYDYLLLHDAPWVVDVKELFTAINCPDIFQNNVRIINFTEFKNYAVDKLLSLYRVKWLQTVESKPKLHLYATYKKEYASENYCQINMKKSQRSLLAKLRLGVLPINIEIGRYSGTPRDERYCPLCNNNSIDDEIHVLLYCPYYNALREALIYHACSICNMFNELDDNNKVGMLASHTNMVRKTAKFLFDMLKIRESKLTV